MGWLSRLMQTERATTELVVTSGACLKKVLEPPFTVSFDVRAPLIGSGLLLWAYSEGWTGSKGGSGFELALGQSRIKICGIDGRPRVDQRFTVPWWGNKHSVSLTVGTDKMLLSMYSKDFPDHIRLQFLGMTPASMTVGVGWPPVPSLGFEGAIISNVKL